MHTPILNMMLMSAMVLPIEVAQNGTLTRHELDVWIQLKEEPITEHLIDAVLIEGEQPTSENRPSSVK